MKRIFLLLFAVGIMNGSSYGQNHQISPGFGVLASNTFLDIFLNIGQNVVGGVFDGTRLENKRYIGDFRLSYAYDVANWFSVGSTFTYARSTADHYKNSVFVGAQSIDYFTLGAEATFYYMKRDHIKLYGLLGGGATMMNKEDRPKDPNEKASQRNYAYFNLQISPFGIAAGGKRIGAFAEFGFGYRGMFSTGMYFRL